MSIPYPSPSRSPAPPSSYDYPPTSSPSRQGQQRQRSSTSESIPVISYPFKQEARDRRGSNTSEMEKGYHYVKQSRQLSSGSQSIERMMDGYEGDGIGMERNGSQDGYQTTGVGYGYAIPQHQANYSSTAALTPLPSYQTSPQPQASGSSTPNTTPSKPSKSRQWLGAKSEKLDITELDEEEKEMLQKGLVDWDELKSWRFWFRREWLWWYLLGIVIATLVILMTLFHKEIVNWLHPVAVKMKEIRFGWLIPIGILILVSQPPLFGAEIVDILCGLVWGLWIGFAIVAVGTFLGELINFYLFRYLLRKRAEKMEKKSMNYGLLSHVIREGGIVMATVVRLSAIPGHVSTVIFSTCGLSVWIFIVATIISMPKHIIIVYLGTLLSSTANTDKKSKIINDSVLAVTFLITLLAAWYIWSKMKKARVPVWRARRAELAAKGMDMSSLPMDPTSYTNKPHMPYARDQGKIEELDDARSPILMNAAEPSRQSMFDTGYDISYGRGEDGMSVYRVDDSTMSSSTRIAFAQPDGRPTYHEADLGERRNKPYDPAPAFPQAQPYMGPNPVRREVSDATTLYSTPTVRSVRNEPTAFPTPQPHPHPGYDSPQGGPQYQTQQSTPARYSLQDTGMAV